MKSDNFEWLLPTPVQGESWRWGRYAGPLQVEFSPGTITWVTESLVDAEVGQRVLVRFYSGTRATIMGVLGGVGQGGLKFGLENLTTQNLNDITRGGFYRQGLSANALASRNYPVGAAGLLEVFDAGAMVWQRYTLYNSVFGDGAGVYNRRNYQGTWHAWEEVQKATKPVVTALTLKNGWVAYGGGYQYPEYEVYPDGHVQLHGLIKPGTKANNTVIATVPASLAPDRQRVFVVGASGVSAGRVDVRPTGEITLAVFGSTTELANVTWLSLETVSW